LRHGPRSRCTISMDGTAESLLRNGTYQMARDIRRDHDQQCVQRDGLATAGDGAQPIYFWTRGPLSNGAAGPVASDR